MYINHNLQNIGYNPNKFAHKTHPIYNNSTMDNNKTCTVCNRIIAIKEVTLVIVGTRHTQTCPNDHSQAWDKSYTHDHISPQVVV